MLAAPIQYNERLSLIDSLRGLALLGILLMNIPFLGLPSAAVENPFILNELSGPNYWCFWAVHVLFDGTMRGIFSMLFGAGTFLLISRLEQKHSGLLPADIYYRRLIWLMVFGLIDAYIILWAGDILLCYGLAGLFFFPFRNLQPKKLLWFAAFLLVISSLQGTINMQEKASMRRKGVAAEQLKKAHKTLTPKQEEHLASWHEFQKDRNVDSVRAQGIRNTAKARRESYIQTQSHMARVNVYLETQKMLPSW